ncbi:hypothetical protein GEMRC1_006725 [Eukaryota sp. GEM-RC1]
MCKHIINAQVSIRAPCCKKWYDCPQCHADLNDHELEKTTELVLACKKCRKVFRVDLGDPEADQADQHCPHCDNCYVLEAVTGEDKEEEEQLLSFERSMDVNAKFDPRMAKSSHPMGEL